MTDTPVFMLGAGFNIDAKALMAGGRGYPAVTDLDERLVVAVDFEKKIVWIKWIGTHAEYDGINVKEVEYEKP